MSLFDDLPAPEPKKKAAPKKAAPTSRATLTPAPPAREEERAPAPAPASAPAGPTVIAVGDLTAAISRRMQELGRVAVEGEITQLKRAASGHLYFSLKDERARIACVIWQSRVKEAARFPLEEGAKVVAHGRLDVYAPRGSYSLIVDRLEPRGLGELLAKLEALKARLREEGWFDRARPLPPMPKVVGVVTSRDADGWRDFLRTRTLRFKGYPLRIAHTRVQGPSAAHEIADAIRRLDASGVDVICVVRGGGSLEDLWAFNELPVAEAIHQASVPVVTGVGHESDTTLADLVADHRAHTPTDAAQTVLPDESALTDRLERAGSYLMETMERALTRREERLTQIASRPTLRSTGWLLERRLERLGGLTDRLVRAGQARLAEASTTLDRRAERLATQSPVRRLAALEARLAGLGPRLESAGSSQLLARTHRLDSLARALEAVSPLSILGRGYSITRTEDGRALRSISEVRPGQRLETLVADGVVRVDVAETEERSDA